MAESAERQSLDLNELPASATDGLVRELAAAFVEHPSGTFWWDHLRVPAESISYHGAPEPFGALVEILESVVGSSGEDLVLLAGIDEVGGGRGVDGFVGALEDMLLALADCPGFEFVIVDLEATWAIFDTHHDAVLVVGSPPSSIVRDRADKGDVQGDEAARRSEVEGSTMKQSADNREDWVALYPGLLVGGEIESAIADHISEVRRSERALRDFLVARGMRPHDRTLANADFGLVEPRGTLPGGGAYWFHGIGAVIKLPAAAPVDVDWDEKGITVIDAFRFGEWLERVGGGRPDARVVANAMDALVDRGVLCGTDWWANFTITASVDTDPAAG